MKRLYALDVRGKLHEWQFEILADEQDAAEWRADGLHVSEIVTTIPQWWI